jgi:hypothetical protein
MKLKVLLLLALIRFLCASHCVESDPDIIIDQTKKMNLDELDLGGLFLEAWPTLKSTVFST